MTDHLRKEDSYEHLLFSGGWILASAGVSCPPHWPSVSFAGASLAHDPRLPVIRRRGSRYDLMLIGRAIDPFHSISDPQAILTQLSNALHRRDFLERLDDLTGRFVVALGDNEGIRLYQDAAGTRAVYYSPGIATSHPELAAEGGRNTENDSLWEAIRTTRTAVKYLPGIQTTFHGVRMLTPNTSLDLATSRVERFWPRTARVEIADISIIADALATTLKKTMSLATAEWPVRISLTAGLDSRTTLAATRGQARDLQYFSYMPPTSRSRTHKIDLAVARDIAQRFTLQHDVLHFGREVAARPGFASFVSVLTRNLGLQRGVPSLVRSYVDTWPIGHIHVKSNVAEIGRVFYKSNRPDQPISPHWLAKWWNPDMTKDPVVYARFAEFCDTTSFNDVSMLGYDPLDLFYWEHRMGTWHSLTTTETDMAHDTFVPYANRRLLAQLLSAPYHVRRTAAVFHQAIRTLWPDLAEWPINPSAWPPPTSDSLA